MSNFLRHLLERTLAPAATLQPRLASRFESGPAPVRFTEERIETFATPAVAPAPSHPVASAASPVASPRAEISSPVASALSVAVPPSAAPPPVLASVLVPLAASSVFPPNVQAPIAPPAQAVSISAPPSTAARETFSLPPASASTLLIERVTDRIRESSPAPGSGTSSSSVAKTSAVTAPTIAPATRTPIAAPLSPAAAPAALPAAPPAAPTIRVTIGRVDIRAIHAPAAPARTPAPERRPLVSLETYLRQRDAK